LESEPERLDVPVERESFEKNMARRSAHVTNIPVRQDLLDRATERINVTRWYDIAVYTLINYRVDSSPIIGNDRNTKGERLHDGSRLSFGSKVAWKQENSRLLQQLELLLANEYARQTHELCKIIPPNQLCQAGNFLGPSFTHDVKSEAMTYVPKETGDLNEIEYALVLSNQTDEREGQLALRPSSRRLGYHRNWVFNTIIHDDLALGFAQIGLGKRRRRTQYQIRFKQDKLCPGAKEEIAVHKEGNAASAVNVINRLPCLQAKKTEEDQVLDQTEVLGPDKQ